MKRILPPTYFVAALVLAVLLGVAVLLGSAAPCLVVPAAAVLFDRVFIGPEERMMTVTFGDRFQQYRKRVRRWL